MKNKPVVYQIRNTVNGHRYVGSTINFDIRVKCHLSTLRRGVHVNPILQRAYRKYGEKSLVFEILEVARTRNLIASEQRYLDQHPEYNICIVAGASRRGLRASPSHRRHMSEALTGRVSPMKGRKFTEQHKRRLALSVHTTKHLRRHVGVGWWSPHCSMCLASLKAALRLKLSKGV